MSLQNLIEEQDETFELIQKARVNFKKTPKVRLTRGYILIRSNTIEDYWSKFKGTHADILRESTKEERSTIPYFLTDGYEQCEQLYIEFQGDLKDMLDTFEPKSNESSPHRHEARHPVQDIKLPVINIPQFAGNYQDWSSFYDLFVSLIHNNDSLSDVQKMHYLKSSMAGEAENLLKHLSITEANYEVAWNTLKNRYNNKRLIVNSILGRLVNQKKLSNGSSKAIREILDTTIECLNKLETLGIDTKTWDAIIIHLTVMKLDPESHKCWEEDVSALEVSELPTFERLNNFLNKRFRVLEMIQEGSSKGTAQQKETVRTKTFHGHAAIKCTYCGQDHALYNCKEFVKLEEDKRSEFVLNQRLCFNCLIPGHPVRFCKSKASCRRCGKKHHSLLHRFTNPTNIPNTTESESPSNENTSEKEIVSCLATGNITALMSTAVINVTNERGQIFKMRALLDPCSQESFISESAVQMIGTKRRSVTGHVSGVGQMKTPIKLATDIQISSRIKAATKMMITTYIVKKITNIMPAQRIHVTNWDHLKELQLADPTYNEPGHIDILLGVDVYNEMLLPGLIKGAPGSPIALQTHLGWILSGKITVGENKERESNIVSMHLNVDLNNMLQKFWELETIEEKSHTLTSDEMKAEEIYKNTTIRDEHGRFVVNLPLRNDPATLPSQSREIALDRFKATERKLNKNAKLREEYNKVLQEYVDLKHLEKVEQTNKERECVYLPHHAVVKEDRETTKVRVVFDASCRGTNGVSLNDELLIGPPLQSELREILLRWRKHKIAFVSDVEKMYRQIRVNTSHTDLQRIIWRSDPMGPIEDYRLLTVTFGTSCAPYLAVKTLQEIAVQEGANYPEARETILQDFYMDDLLSGRDDEEGAIDAQREIKHILEAGGFKLQKWCSNSKRFMREINQNNFEETTTVEIQKGDKIKTLGLTWEVKEDTLSIANQIKDSCDENTTKRKVLSEIASLFDPMGWIAPVVVLAKIFMQKLWKSELSWDESLSEDLKAEWLRFKQELPLLNKVSVNRWIFTTQRNKTFELHGFADASASAYAAVIYARVIDEEGQVKVSLITAKTKVAPINKKQVITLPRLELCAAVLLSKLIKQVAAALKVDSEKIYAWSDSQVVLAWIHGDPTRWTPFVKNRVTEIVETVNSNQWYYVNTKQNPADPASRGVMPTRMLAARIWWNGPEMLKEEELVLNKGNILETSLENKKEIVCALTKTDVQGEENEEILTFLRRYSSLGKLVRVVAYCRRWLLTLKKMEKENLPTYLTADELNAALTNCIKLSQEREFPEEMASLRNHRPLLKRSRLLLLNPFLDEKGVLRVGGRLKHADIEFTRKHPVIISKDNVLLPLLLSEAHMRTLHGGPQMMITYLRSKYWLIDATNTVKRYVRKCAICARQMATNRIQLMGELPKVRVTPARPFFKGGVDYAGPLNILTKKGRGAKTTKAYIALFICMVTKAIHLELVSDLSSDAFIASFKRFVARRGRCSDIWSDQGSNFRGAAETLANAGTQWHFVPPYSPNFGGLWEAGVKSVKYHLKRTLQANLTFEEMVTVLTQIEACINSRPLEPLNGPDLDVLEPLTPGHFLIGESLITVPAQDYTEVKMNRLSRWQYTQRLVQDFWKRWYSEYLSRLQQRPKWLSRSPEFQIGEVVLVKEDNLPPGKWSLARIIEKHPGHDKIARVYTIKYRGKLTKRSISKLCAFPVESRD